MTDREALLATIRANPHDDVPRLIYADWCEESGAAAYAAFVRAHVELARMPPVRTLYRTNKPLDVEPIHLVQFKTTMTVKVGEELDLFYANGVHQTVLVLGIYGEEIEARIYKDSYKSSEPHKRRRQLKEQIRKLWKEGEVVRHAVPESMSVEEVGLSYKRDNRGIIERGLLGTLILGEMDAEEIYDEVSKTFPITRIVLAGDWRISVRSRVEHGYLPDDVQLDMRWRVDGRPGFVSELSDAELISARGVMDDRGGWRDDVRYVLEREVERRNLSQRIEEGTV